MASSFSGSRANIRIGEHRFLHCELSGTTATITGATSADPVVITAVAHGFTTGDRVRITSVVGMTEINNRDFLIEKVTDDTFKLQGEDGSGHTSYGSDGTATKYTVTDFGITEGGSELNIERMYRDRSGDQEGGTVLDRLNAGDKVSGRVVLKELTASLLAKLDPVGNLTAAGTTSGARYEFGGDLAGANKASDSAFLLVLHPMDKDDEDPSGEHRVYECVPEGPVPITQPKNDDQTYAFSFMGLPDTDRARGYRTYGFFD